MGANDKIALCIPSIPPRSALLTRALISAVPQQLRQPAEVHVAIDHDRLGAAATRQRALMAASKDCDWVAFLDDDDEFLPHHLSSLLAHARDTGADYVFSWFHVVAAGGRVLRHDPVFPPTHFSEPWDPANPRQTTITVLVRRGLAQQVGFVPPVDGQTVDGQVHGEDWTFTLECNRLGKVSHLVQRTWLWHHDSNNTSGRPDRW